MRKTKQCFKCLKRRNVKHFYAHPETADGLLGKCKECTKANSASNRKANHEYYVAYDKKRNQLLHRIEARAEYAATEQGRERGNAAKHAWSDRNPEKRKASVAANNALRDGRLERKTKCEICGGEKNIEKHHDDYNKPLEVRWLCKRHHWEADRKLRPVTLSHAHGRAVRPPPESDLPELSGTATTMLATTEGDLAR